MYEYQFLPRKGSEKLKSFEARINEMAAQGWRVIELTRNDWGNITAVLERSRNR